MTFTYPHTIDNGGGERLVFKRLINDDNGQWLEFENFVEPNAGPPMHVHHKQDEHLTVITGRMGTQILKEAPVYYGPGEGATFKAGQAHKFWNAGDGPLICSGWIKPANNLEYFLTEIYSSTRKNGGKRPGSFDSAWLLDRYSTEFDMLDIPAFVKKVIFPITIFFGKLTGKHKKFSYAPEPFE